MRNRHINIVCVLAFLLTASASAQDKDKKEEKKPEPPRIIMSAPLAVSPGEKVAITLRGMKLDNVTAVRIGEGEKKIDAAIKNKGGSKPPDRFDAKLVGDTKAEIEFALAADAPGVSEGKIKIVAINDGGESNVYELLVMPPDRLVEEKEPNDDLRKPQMIEAGKTILGAMAGNDQVDVYGVAAKKGEKITIEVFAGRRGSAFDASITLFDPTSNIVTMVDDLHEEERTPDKRDCRLAFTASTDGVYVIVLQDAMARGAETHPYLLSIKRD